MLVGSGVAAIIPTLHRRPGLNAAPGVLIAFPDSPQLALNTRGLFGIIELTKGYLLQPLIEKRRVAAARDSIVMQVLFEDAEPALAGQQFPFLPFALTVAAMTPEHLQLLLTREMPYGKYKGRVIADLPGHYLGWFAREGFPRGEIGELLALMYELDHNALRSLLDPLRGRR